MVAARAGDARHQGGGLRQAESHRLAHGQPRFGPLADADAIGRQQQHRPDTERDGRHERRPQQRLDRIGIEEPRGHDGQRADNEESDLPRRGVARASDGPGQRAGECRELGGEVDRTTPSKVPTWMATSKTIPNCSASQPKSARARMRCAELEMGRNSVSPWTIPSNAASNSIRGLFRRPALRAVWTSCGPAAPAPPRAPRATRPRRLSMIAIAAAMKTVEYVPLTMPTSIVKANPRSTSPPNRYSDSTARNVVPAVMTVRPSVWLTALLTTCSSGVLPHRPEVLAHAVEHDNRVVDRIAGDGQNRRHDVEGQLVAEEAQERHGHQDVVERRRDGAEREARAEAERDVQRDADNRRQRGVDPLELQLAADDGADDLAF